MPKKNATLEALITAEVQNSISVQEFADRIRAELQGENKNWQAVAQILGAVGEQFGFNSNEMKGLTTELQFGASTGKKLIQISKCNRLAEHSDKFSDITAWTVLYKITTLTDSQFAALLNAVTPQTVTTMGFIDNVLGKSKTPTPSNFKPLFTVEVDINALRGLEFDADGYEKITEALEKLRIAVPLIKISDSGLFEREYDRYQQDLKKAYDQALWKLAKKAVAEYKSHSSEWKANNNLRVRRALKQKLPLIGPYEDEANIREILKSDPKAVFDNLEADWFSVSLAMEEAQNIVDANRNKYVKKIAPTTG